MTTPGAELEAIKRRNQRGQGSHVQKADIAFLLDALKRRDERIAELEAERNALVKAENQWNDNYKHLEAELAEAHTRAMEYKTEWESAVYRELGLKDELAEAYAKNRKNLDAWMREKGKVEYEQSRYCDLAKTAGEQIEFLKTQLAAQEAVVEMWIHGCDGVFGNVTLWKSRCPHCGKPSPSLDAKKPSGGGV